MDIDNAEYGWHHQTAIIKLKDEYKARAERAEAALRTLVEAGWDVYCPTVMGSDGGARLCAECGNPLGRPTMPPNQHKAGCSWGILWGALKQARAALPKEEANDGEAR